MTRPVEVDVVIFIHFSLDLDVHWISLAFRVVYQGGGFSLVSTFPVCINNCVPLILPPKLLGTLQHSSTSEECDRSVPSDINIGNIM